MTTEPSLVPSSSIQRYRTVVEGMDLANEFTRSRMTAAEFARQRGVTVRMITYWTKRARQLAAATAPEVVQVAEFSASGAIELPSAEAATAATAIVSVPSPATPLPPPTIEVRLPNGVRIGVAAGFSPAVLAQVVACLGRPC